MHALKTFNVRSIKYASYIFYGPYILYASYILYGPYILYATCIRQKVNLSYNNTKKMPPVNYFKTMSPDKPKLQTEKQ